MDCEALESVCWHANCAWDSGGADSLEVWEAGKVLGGARAAVANLDNTVGECQKPFGATVQVERLENDRRDRVREGVCLNEAGETVHNHRVDVWEELEDGAGVVGECGWVHLEREGCLAAALRDERKCFDRFNLVDMEEDVGQEDGLEAG